MTKFKRELFFYLLIYTSIFLLIEISFFIQCNKIYLTDLFTLSDLPRIPIIFLPQALYFLCAQLIVHLIFCFSVWLLILLLIKANPKLSNHWMSGGLCVWSLIIITIFFANQHYYPNSKFAELTSSMLPNPYADYLFYSLLFCCFLLLCCASIGFLKLLSKKSLCYLSIISMGLYSGMMIYQKHPSSIAAFNKPNIIIIGVDSLRPDFLSYFGAKRATPFFDSFLKQARVFNQTVTPIARTFPSWMSILTGAYPRENGIRTNLANQNKINTTTLLPVILQHHGYETVYASDETRFSNITKTLGFDQIITPPIGLGDFLIGTFNDFPLSNLILSTTLGRYLFPYSYGNRPVYFTYEPEQFLNLLQPLLNKPRTKPLFLAVHFCLPHFPYIAADASQTNLSAQEQYANSIIHADQQIEQFFHRLQNAHLLDNTIVVLLSDHGEALELPGDRITEKYLFVEKNKAIPEFYPKMMDSEALNQSAGHGTDVLSLVQYHTLLAFQWYGNPATHWQPGLITNTVSLIDIKPTLLELTGISAAASTGHSLVPQLAAHGKPPSHKRHLFLESDFTPESIRTVYPEMRKVLLDNVQHFQIDPITMRLTIKSSMEQMIIKSKQYADIYDEWILALYPQSQTQRIPVLVNLKSGQWTIDLHSRFAKQSPAQHMLDELKRFYGTELTGI